MPVEKDYEFDTEDGKKTLADLFEGRSQLLAYNIMYGPDYEIGACPGCTSLGDELDAPRVHLDHQDVTLICFSRAPIDRLTAYKQRMGWTFPYVSTYGSDFPFDFGLALTPEQAQEIPEVRQMLADPPEFLQDWSKQVGAKLEDGLREAPSCIAFARDNGTVYHTYTVTAPDPFVAPYHSFLLRRTPEAAAGRARGQAQGRVRRGGAVTATACAASAARSTSRLAGRRAGRAAPRARGVGPDRRPHDRHGRRARAASSASLGWFASSWLVMMAAMMLPAAAPMAGRVRPPGGAAADTTGAFAGRLPAGVAGRRARRLRRHRGRALARPRLPRLGLGRAATWRPA